MTNMGRNTSAMAPPSLAVPRTHADWRGAGTGRRRSWLVVHEPPNKMGPAKGQALRGNRREQFWDKVTSRWPMLRKTLLVLIIAVVIVGGVAAALAWRLAIDPVRRPTAESFDPALVKRGGELAAIGNCATCHTVPGGRPFAGGVAVP